MTAYDDAVDALSPWGYWPTDEASGNLLDASGNGRTLTRPGGNPAYQQTGPDGSSLDAQTWPDSSGGTEYYAISAATLGSTITALTVVGWFEVSGAPTNPTPVGGIAYGYGNNSQRPAIAYLDTSKRLNFWWGNSATSGARITTAALADGFYFFAGVMTSTGAKLRINGIDMASGSHSAAIASTGMFFVHGGGNVASFANLTNGSALKIAKPALFLAALTDDEIDSMFYAMVGIDGAIGAALPALAAELFGIYDGAIDGALDARLPHLQAALAGVVEVGFIDGTLTAILPPLQAELYGLYEGETSTDTTNALNGRERGGGAILEAEPPAASPPAGLLAAQRLDKAVAYPTPTLVKGMPT